VRTLALLLALTAASCGSSSSPPPGAPDASMDDAMPASDLAAQAADAPAEDGAVSSDATANVSADTAGDGAPGVGADATSAATCGAIDCPDLFSLAAQCQPSGACQSSHTAAGYNECFANGVRRSSSNVLMGTRLEVDHHFFRPDGAPCYTVETSAELSGGDQTLTWKDPAGRVIVTGVAHGPERVVLTCHGAEYDITDMKCPGTTLAGADPCPEGACP
jgi:hypothetical protein